MSGRGRARARARLLLGDLRVRLALLGAGLFLLTGTVLIAVTHTLLRRPAPEPPPVEAEPGARGRLTLLDSESGPVTALPAETTGAATSAHPVLIPGVLALVLTVLAAALAGWLLAGRVLRPLRRATETARRASRGGGGGGTVPPTWPPSIPPGAPPGDGVRDLTAALDTLADRLARSTDTPRRFAVHAVRELAEPVAEHRSRIETVLRDAPPSAGIHGLGEQLLDVAARQEHVLAGLLLLARTGERAPARGPVDLAPLADRAVARMEREAAASRVTVHLAARPAPAWGDMSLLEALVAHLVANAVRHNTRDGLGWVRVRTGTAPDGQAEIEVGNSGPLIPVDAVPDLFEPFRRLTRDRVGSASGPGLGLAIVGSVARTHTAVLTAHPHPEGGLTITATLPASPHPRR
ncbi:sensor histidine kinase [Streptomyces avicenniae]|uniref:sensor histidine kinase n=1 Tax=Streptomyces avicenniae TaxID=500153 RepID=UPI00069B5DA4|nr:HAMP domain-containing sensor histidine kinase [Streptomyces avicenniae]